MILGHHGGEPLLLFAAIGGAGALPALLLLARARVSQLRRSHRDEVETGEMNEGSTR